jgi:4-azaleucine resistance transporter AzlC
MSVIVFAGSAQLISVGLFAAGVSPLSIIATTFVVNLRHLLMSAALSPHLAGWRKSELAAFAYEITDETFAVHSLRFNRPGPSKAVTFIINLVSQAAWVIGTALGILAGQLIADVRPFGLDYALPAMFIALLVMQIQSHTHLWVAIFSGIVSLVLFALGLDQWNVILATVLGATLGVFLQSWTKTSS